MKFPCSRLDRLISRFQWMELLKLPSVTTTLLSRFSSTTTVWVSLLMRSRSPTRMASKLEWRLLTGSSPKAASLQIRAKPSQP